MNIRPLSDRVIIESFVEEKTDSGIIIPYPDKEKIQKGKVIFIGKGNSHYHMTVKPNDIVIYNKCDTTEISINNKDYLIIHESDIFAII